MQTFHEAGPDFDELSRQSKVLLGRILPQLAALKKELKLPANEDLYSRPGSEACVYVLRDGMLRYERDGRLILLYDEGDLLGAERLFFRSEARLSSEFTTVLDEYDGKAVLSRIATDPAAQEAWQKYLLAQTCILTSLLACALAKEVTCKPKLKSYRQGETILVEGGAGQDVYLLMDGKAEVWLQGRQIGEVQKDEIFGALAVLTGKPRTATVKAACNCNVMSMPVEHFQDLIKNRPQSAWALLQSLARIIVDLDQRLVKLTPPV